MLNQLEQLIASMQDGGILYSEAVREFKKRFLLEILRRHRGNQCRAARELSMHRNTLARTLAGLRIDARQTLPDSSRRKPSSVGVQSCERRVPETA